MTLSRCYTLRSVRIVPSILFLLALFSVLREIRRMWRGMQGLYSTKHLPMIPLTCSGPLTSYHVFAGAEPHCQRFLFSPVPTQLLPVRPT
jgi:hypothetical protein